MDQLIKAFGPVFAAGFAVQQLLEIISPLAEKFPANKKLVLGFLSLAVGLALAGWGGFSILLPLGFTSTTDFIDVFVTGLVISAGTEGVNSIMKFLGYTKENKKGEAAGRQGNLDDDAKEIMKSM
ncbi:MAG: hypothetical protein DWQ04_18455 [Chloroflexi bacterium]|nr:MAG: hypothetical protein DWQ04_18455 [Chloroflexota bacterium]